MIIKIAHNFSKMPGPRYKSEGTNSGEEFREKILYPAIVKSLSCKELVTIDLDGTNGYGCAFLEEAFGGLIDYFPVNQLLPNLHFISTEEPDLIDVIITYIQIRSKERKEMKLLNVFNLAMRAHADQKRKTGEPYINHPLEVMMRVKDFCNEYNAKIYSNSINSSFQGKLPNTYADLNSFLHEELGKDADLFLETATHLDDANIYPLDDFIINNMLAASLVHDVIEDCPHISEKEIEDASNQAVLDLVKQLTNPSKGSKALRAERKQMDRDHLKKVSWEAKVIKLIDRTCNLSDVLKFPDKDFIKLYASESRLLLDCLAGTNADLESDLLRAIEFAETIANPLIENK